LYGTVEGIEFQQGLPDLDNLDPREKQFDQFRRSHGRNGEMIGIIGFQNIIGFFFMTL
jgi:hypothetical protein